MISSNDSLIFSPFFRSSTTERFLSVTKHKLVKFGAHAKRRSGFPKEYSLTLFKKIPFCRFLFPNQKLGPSSQMLESINMTILLNFTDLAQLTISDYQNIIQYELQSSSKNVNIFAGLYATKNYSQLYYGSYTMSMQHLQNKNLQEIELLLFPFSACSQPQSKTIKSM